MALATILSDEIEARPKPAEADLKAVRDLAAIVWKKRKKAEILRAEADALDVAADGIERRDLPDALRKAGSRSLLLDGGFEVRLEDVAHGSISEENRPAAIAFLKEAGLDDVIKTVVSIFFGRGEEKAARNFVRALNRRKRRIEFEVEETIHAKTLRTFIKNRVAAERAGRVSPEKNLPRDLFGIFEFTHAVLVGPEKSSKKEAKQ